MPLILLVLALLFGCGVGEVRADDQATQLDFMVCGQSLDFEVCDRLVARSDFDIHQRATAYATRGWARLRSGNVAAAQRLDIHNDSTQILRDALAKISTDRVFGPEYHCVNDAGAQARIAACTQLINTQIPRSLGQDAAYIARGPAYFAAGDFAAARNDLAGVLVHAPGNGTAQLDYIISLYALGDYAGALAATDQALSVMPYPSADFTRLRGQLDYLLGRRDDALQDLRRAVKLYPSDWDSTYWLSLLRLEYHEDVSADFAQLLAMPISHQFNAALVHFQLGQINAADLLAKAGQISGEAKQRALCVAYSNLGHKAWLSGDMTDARQDFREASQVNKHDMIEYQASKVLLQKLGG